MTARVKMTHPEGGEGSRTAAANTHASSTESTQRLTIGQRARLLANCWPFMAVLVLTGFFLIVLVERYSIYERPPLLFYAAMGVALLFTGYDAAVSLWDIIRGVALVRDDLLERSWTTTRPGRCYGRFQQLGQQFDQESVLRVDDPFLVWVSF